MRRIAPHAARTRRPGVLGELGGFGAGFELDTARWRRPVLVSATDGVGTKLKIAAMAGRWGSVGIDLVAMCVNDIVTTGAEPLFFLDYVGTGVLEPHVVEQVVAGIADGCSTAGCALVGGETAELPGMYQEGELDLAGFAVGCVEHDERLGPHRVQHGDVLIGVASSGLHSNGYSLVRRLLLDRGGLGLDAVLPELGRPLVDELLEPTRIYVSLVRTLAARGALHAAAHITGGGLLENVPRLLPEGCAARIEDHVWDTPPIFALLQREGSLTREECLRTFNDGVGMVLAVPPDAADGVLDASTRHENTAWIIGEVTPGDGGVELVGCRG